MVVHRPAFYDTMVVDPVGKGGVTGVAAGGDLEATEAASGPVAPSAPNCTTRSPSPTTNSSCQRNDWNFRPLVASHYRVPSRPVEVQTGPRNCGTCIGT